MIKSLLPLLMPVMMHTLTPDGMDSIEEGLEIINIYLYHGFKQGETLPAEIWRLLPQLMTITIGDETDVDGGFAFEFLSQTCTIVQNYISRDQQTLFTVGQDQPDTFFKRTQDANNKRKSSDSETGKDHFKGPTKGHVFSMLPEIPVT